MEQRACQSHNDLDKRVFQVEKHMEKVDDQISDILDQLKSQAVSTAEVKSNIDLILSQQSGVSSDIKELRTDMLSIVNTTLTKTHDEMVAFIEMSEKHRQEQNAKDSMYRQKQEQRELDYKQLQDTREQDFRRMSETNDKKFYRRLIIGCFTVLATVTLAFYGISHIIKIFE